MNSKSASPRLIHPAAGTTLTLALCTALCSWSVQAQTILTSTLVASADANGNHTRTNIWNTNPGDIVANVFLTPGSGLANPFINGPTDAQVPISIPLSLGDNSFTLFASGGSPQSYCGINLYFNASLSPSISAFAPGQTLVGVVPAFSANGGTTWSPNWPSTAPGANTLSFIDSGRIITLTSFSWAAPSVYQLDRTSNWPGNAGTTSPDGSYDWVGHITLNVVPVPEPTTGALLGLGLLGLVASRCGKRDRK